MEVRTFSFFFLIYLDGELQVLSLRLCVPDLKFIVRVPYLDTLFKRKQFSLRFPVIDLKSESHWKLSFKGREVEIFRAEVKNRRAPGPAQPNIR